MSTLIIYITVGLLFIIIGFLAKRSPQIIAGYSRMIKDETDENRITNFILLIQKSMAVTGVIIMIGGLITYLLAWQWGTFAFILIPTLLMTIYITIRSRSILPNSSKASLVIVTVATIFVCVTTAQSLNENDIYINNHTISISGEYGEDIVIEHIEDIKLLDSLPKILYRSNGFALGHIKKGRFKVQDIGDVKLFLNTNNNRCIMLKTKDKRYYFLNFSEENKTESCYQEISMNRTK